MTETLRQDLAPSAAAARPSAVRRDGLTARERWRRVRLSSVARLRDTVLRLARRHPAGWRWLAGRYHPVLDRTALASARSVCALAALDVPAYRDFLASRPAAGGRRGRRELADYPETDKESYVVGYGAARRCWAGRLPDRGVVVDESAGSSGRPFNWPRSERELRTVHHDIAGYTSLAFPMRRPFVINAYSMGAWATGTTTGAAMARIAVVKNTGPDLGRIVDTLHEFGPDFDYLVTAYPPFLKHLRDRLDADGFDWARYRIRASCGGEGMTEALRGYLEQRFDRVRSAYGASDLTIGIGAETAFTVWLRRRMWTDETLRAALLGDDEPGAGPGRRDVCRRHPLPESAGDPAALAGLAPDGPGPPADVRIPLAHRLLGVSVHPRHHRVLRRPGRDAAFRPLPTPPEVDDVGDRRHPERERRLHPALHRRAGRLLQRGVAGRDAGDGAHPDLHSTVDGDGRAGGAAMTAAATLERVADRRALREFLAVPDRVYPDDGRFVPHTHQQIRQWWRAGVPMYLLRDGGTGAVLGRTTLHTDAAFDARLGRRCQLFGLTEFTEPAAEPLLDAITAAGRAAGDRETLFGPVALLPNETGGVITSGYADRGFVDSAYNPPRYVTAYESYGFVRRFESDTWICPVTPEPTVGGPGVAAVDPELRVHRGDLRRLDEQLHMLHGLLNASFAQLGYYTEIPIEELRRQTDGLAYLLDESLLLYLTRAGRPVAFVLCVPDLSEFLVRVRGDLNLVNRLRLLATRRRYRREAVLVVKGVLPEYQGRGYQRLLSAQLRRNLHAGGYRTLRSTYVGRDNPASAAQFRAMGGRPLHGYTFYEKAL
ncbi:hypothetical protein O7626_05300 [Micromonospora sp. WMMD1102]|uniref:hypothetical protein n=1 Tax=Micromonospora sp. WMMD1102 TaxID=3016105 RepID=UPI0024159345|nr:hypothetical protein [Micromonospora sp. WMMD1102]MDG4785354.1 hypothetical protein [Micromonospora sp. WMMD1102]